MAIFQATLSFENRTRETLRAWGVSLDTFSTLVALEGFPGIGRTVIGEALRGKRNLLVEVVERLEPFDTELAAFVNLFAPFRPVLDNAVEVHEWLAAVRQGRITIKVAQE
jgi:hypothetical protein